MQIYVDITNNSTVVFIEHSYSLDNSNGTKEIAYSLAGVLIHSYAIDKSLFHLASLDGVDKNSTPFCYSLQYILKPFLVYNEENLKYALVHLAQYTTKHLYNWIDNRNHYRLFCKADSHCILSDTFDFEHEIPELMELVGCYFKKQPIDYLKQLSMLSITHLQMHWDAVESVANFILVNKIIDSEDLSNLLKNKDLLNFNVENLQLV